jgi:hypothetical protein
MERGRIRSEKEREEEEGKVKEQTNESFATNLLHYLF